MTPLHVLADGRHFTLYTNYLGRIFAEDRDLIVPSLIPKLTLVGTRGQPRTRISKLEAAGIDEIVIQPVVAPDQELATWAN